jgi:hypothetical protein
MVLKKGPDATAEKDLIAGVIWPEDGLPIAGIQMGPGTEATLNGETFLEEDVNISLSVAIPSLDTIRCLIVNPRKYNFFEQQPRSIHRSYVP